MVGDWQRRLRVASVPSKTSNLKKVLEDAAPAIRAALDEAEHKLAALHTRRRELEDEISHAKSVLGISLADSSKPAAAGGRGLTLHEAIAQVLDDHGNDWMTVSALADEINSRQLYAKRDGSAVETNQIHARVTNYSKLFEKDPDDKSLVRKLTG